MWNANRKKSTKKSLTDSRSVSPHRPRSKPKGPEIHTVACINYRRPKVKSRTALARTYTPVKFRARTSLSTWYGTRWILAEFQTADERSTRNEALFLEQPGADTREFLRSDRLFIEYMLSVKSAPDGTRARNSSNETFERTLDNYSR